MDHYLKTDLGIQALKQRSFQLNARQRQLLLLIGTDDFRILNSALKQRLATPELIQQLEALGLIFHRSQSTHSNFTKDSPLPKETENPFILDNNDANNDFNKLTIKTVSDESSSGSSKHIESNKTKQLNDFHSLNFSEIQELMNSLLRNHCGLMAKQLMLQIQNAQSIREIKMCQMQWITALQETRILPTELNRVMQHINHSIQHLQTS